MQYYISYTTMYNILVYRHKHIQGIKKGRSQKSIGGKKKRAGGWVDKAGRLYVYITSLPLSRVFYTAYAINTYCKCIDTHIPTCYTWFMSKTTKPQTKPQNPTRNLTLQQALDRAIEVSLDMPDTSTIKFRRDITSNPPSPLVYQERTARLWVYGGEHTIKLQPSDITPEDFLERGREQRAAYTKELRERKQAQYEEEQK